LQQVKGGPVALLSKKVGTGIERKKKEGRREVTLAHQGGGSRHLQHEEMGKSDCRADRQNLRRRKPDLGGEGKGQRKRIGLPGRYSPE